jgi:hypothetical protein
MSNQIYYDKYTKYKLKYDNLKMQLNNQKGGGDCIQHQLMPPIFTMMYQYMKNKNISYEKISEQDILNFLVDTFKTFKTTKKISKEEYIDMCSKLFNDNIYYKIERIYDRIYPIECKIEDETKKNRLLFINFKSFEILNKDHREKFFEIITKTSPDYICLTEALVPNCFANRNIFRNEGKSYIHYHLEFFLDHDIVGHPMKKSDTPFAKKKREGYLKEVNKRFFTQEGDGNITIDKKGNVTLNNVWIQFFVDNGYKFLSFGNPIDCPYGDNWGNCIISKKEPKYSNRFEMISKKTHKKDTLLVNSGLVTIGESESRCMVHITIDEYGEDHHILCTHLDDSDENIRVNQVDEIIKYIRDENLQGKITLVGDLNALNEESYTVSERLLLRQLNNNYLPTREIPIFNEFFKAFDTKDTKDTKVTLINRKQKYESAFQKCVSHGYSNTYTDSLLIFTDATTFDHQPLLLLKGSNNEPESK